MTTEPGPVTFAGTSRTVNTPSGLIHYHDYGHGDPLVLLHGSGPGVSSWSNFSGNLPRLGRFRRVLAVDMPGFGSSDAVDLDRSYPEVAARVVGEVVEQLGLGPVDVLGNSMGGWVACELALARPHLIRRLVLMGPGGLAAGTFTAGLSEGACRLFEFVESPTRDALVRWLATMVFDRRLLTDELVEQRWKQASAPGVLDSTRAIFASLADPARQPPLPLWARAQAITQPTLVTWGRDDRMVPLEMGAFAFARLGAAELHVFGNCGHWAQIERRDQFERVVLEFLTRELLSSPDPDRDRPG